MFDDNRYCIKMNLVQQTPMIHFQASEDMKMGLGPRTTEVKPKLDRFAAEWYKKKYGGNDLPDEWKVEYDEDDDKKDMILAHSALNYVLRITATNTPVRETGKQECDNRIPCIKGPDKYVKTVYFGNMGDAKKLQIFNRTLISLYIRCFIPELKALLQDCIETFFLLHNFGTRQDKGLGSFVSEGMTSERAKELIREWIPNSTIGMIDYTNASLQSSKSDNGSIWIGEIGTIYKMMKSGINYSGSYIKSALTEFFLKDKDSVIIGEKRVMKERGIAPIVYTHEYKRHETVNLTESENAYNERYIRGLLGYGKNQRWFSSDENHNKVKVIKNNGMKSYKQETIRIIPSEDTDIERIPSPILFKVINRYIFIIPQDIKVYGKEFVFSSDNTRKGIGVPVKLEIPSEKEFDIDEFMRWFIDWLDNKNGQRNIVSGNVCSHIFEENAVVISCL